MRESLITCSGAQVSVGVKLRPVLGTKQAVAEAGLPFGLLFFQPWLVFLMTSEEKHPESLFM